MTDADTAFAAAQGAIREAKRSGAEFLHFSVEISGEKFRALRTLPEEIGNLAMLRVLTLDQTQVTSLAALQNLPALQTLWLNRAPVTDLAPLAFVPALRSLSLEDTPVSDLRPIKDLPNLGFDADREHLSSGLRFQRCLACSHDPEGLGRLSMIGDDEDRTRRTLKYLQNLTHWPPRPLDVVIPEQDAALYIAPNPDEDGKLDVRPATPSAEEITEQLKQTLYTRLKNALDDFIAATGNQHYRITQHARLFRTSLPEDFARADLVSIYIELNWFRGIDANRAERSDALPDAAVDALHEIGTVGPGLVLDNAEVERMEDRRRRWNEPALSAEAAAAMDALSESIAENSAVFGQRLRSYEAVIVSAVDAPASRRNLVQRILNRNVLIAVGCWLAAEATGGIVADAAVWAASNPKLILSVAATYGETFAAWLAPLLAHAQQIAALAQGSGVTTMPLGLPPRTDPLTTDDTLSS